MKLLKKTAPYIITYIGAVVLGLLLLFLVSLIPQGWLTENWKDGRDASIRINTFDLFIEGDYSTYLDNYTDDMKMDLAYRLNEHSIITPTAVLTYIDGSFMEYYEYGRYWQGYCVILRPLMLFFNYNTIQMIAGVTLVILLLVLMYQLFKQQKYAMMIAIIASIFLTKAWINVMRLQYFNCTCIALLSTILILRYYDMYKKHKGLVFFIIGICVAYFDFLTFETLTLTFPLFIAESCDDNKYSFKDKCLTIIKPCVTWCLGYILMFSSKWLIYMFYLRDEGINTIISRLLLRSGLGENTRYYTVFESIKLNLERLDGITFDNLGIILIVLLIYTFFMIFQKGGDNRNERYIVYFLIGLIPIIRFVLIREHSSSHSMFTYRALITTVMCYVYPIASVLINSLGLRKKRRKIS